MKILYVTDLHGNEKKYKKIYQIAKKIRADVVINGGDMLPKIIHISDQRKFIKNFLDPYFVEFETNGIYHLSFLGNDDLKIFDQFFDKICDKYSLIFNIAQKKIRIKNFDFIGMNWVVDYPFRIKDRCRLDTKNDDIFPQQHGKGLLSIQYEWREIDNWALYAKSLPTIEEELNNLVKPKNMSNTIYIIHMPPCELGLDQCINDTNVGSKAIYDFLQKNQPRISLHGHIHESPYLSGIWSAKIGKTWCIQPGQLNDLSYVVIDLSFDGNIKINRQTIKI